MNSSPIVALFTQPPSSRRSPSSFMASVLLHAAGCVCLFFGLRHVPQIVGHSSMQRFTVRILNVPKPEPLVQQAAGSGAKYPVAKSAAHRLPSGGSPAKPSIPVQLAQLRPATQTLVQPEAPPDLLIAQEPSVPLILRWAHEDTPIKAIVLPPPRQVIVNNPHPLIHPPNRELAPADVKISSTAFKTKLPILPPSTTSPIVVRRPDPVRQVPQTASKLAAESTPAQVISLSDLRMQSGPIAVPLVNTTSRPVVSESMAAGRSDNSAQAGHGNPASKQTGVGPGQGSSAPEGKAPAGSGAVAQTGTASGPGQGSEAGSGTIDELSVTRISRPKDGQFGVVVVGSSLAEQYPETVGIWSGRLVYTVYLHVGLGKNWILQYSLPLAGQTAATGGVTRPEAPWPYDIVRPHLDPADYTSDAVMVHGFVNPAGRFERLAVVFPTEFAQAKFVLGALQQWAFRPARQNGQVAAVEVLLIIPEETE